MRCGSTQLTRAQIPKGVRDLFAPEAYQLRNIEAQLLNTFRSWGYQDVIPPTFEFYENMAVGVGESLERAMFKFVDGEGALLALRGDITNGVARVLATKLADAKPPLRVCYSGAVFRQERSLWGKHREFHQAGVELVGGPDALSDVEVLTLAVEILRDMSLEGCRINLGHIGYFKALVSGADLDEVTLSNIRQAVDNRDQETLKDLVESTHLTREARTALLALPELCGGAEMLDRAARLTALPEAQEAISRLRHLHQALTEDGLEGRVLLDLAEVKGIEYYTGIMFEGFVPGMGFPILSGGRYDNLLAQFGRPLAAVGFALTLERLLLALPATAGAPRIATVVPGAARDREVRQMARALRAAGIPTVVGDQVEAAELVFTGLADGHFRMESPHGAGVVLPPDPAHIRAALGAP